MGGGLSRCRAPRKGEPDALQPSPDPRLRLWAAAAARNEAQAGENAAVTLSARMNLAKALRTAGAVGEARALLEDVLERQLESHGEGSEDALLTQQALASLLIEERPRARPLEFSVPAEARTLIEAVVAKKKQALAVELKVRGDEHMAHGDTVTDDDAAAATNAYTEALRVYSNAIQLDPDDKELQELKKLAKRKAKAGSDDAAQDGAAQDSSGQPELGETESATRGPKMDPLTEGLGDCAIARPLEEAVVAGFVSSFGSDDERTVQARMQLARTLRRLGQHAEARPQYEAVLAAKGDADGEFAAQRTSRVIAQANLAVLLYEHLGEHEEVRPTQSQVFY